MIESGQSFDDVLRAMEHRRQGDLLFDRIRSIVSEEAARAGRDFVSTERGIAIAMRELRPYVRNRFSIIDASTAQDRYLRRLRLRIFDHAEGRHVPPAALVAALIDGATP